MPLPSFSAEEYFDKNTETLAKAFRTREGVRSWILVILILLNTSVSVVRSLDKEEPKSPSLAQRHAFFRICESTIYMCDLKAQIPDRNWNEFLASRTVSYTGEDHLKAQKLTWIQVEPGLPTAHHCASINVLGLAEGPVLDYFLNPDEALIESMPDIAPKPGAIMISPGEGIPIMKNLLRLGLVRALPESELIYIGGRPLVNGMFGVSKGKPVPGNEHLEVLRLIMNLTASNSVMEDLRGDIHALPYFGQ